MGLIDNRFILQDNLVLVVARKSVRAQWAAKIEGKLAPVDWGVPDIRSERKQFHGTVLGIDPSLRGTGLAVLRFEPGQIATLLFSQTLRLKAKYPMAHCLGEISRAVNVVLDRYEIDHVVLEQPIYVQNMQTALILGAARGAAISAAASRGFPVYEYAPLRVKQAVVGFGRASKEQLARTVRSLLEHRDLLKPDEADAAGVALCHALTYRG